jgi:hypothetical protein
MTPLQTDPNLPEIVMPWWLDLISLMPIIIAVLFVIYFWRFGLSGTGFMKKQSDYLEHQKSYLDHQRTVNERSLDQNKQYEEMIVRQYAETNARSDRALAQSDEAIRLHAAALDQLSSMNETLTRLARILEADRPSAST